MPNDTSAPPEAEACLTTPRSSSFNGGTLIVASVRDRATHEGLIRDPDGYRPAECARCRHDVLHVCAYPERRPRGEADDPPLRIVQYVCANEACGATWRMLPGFLARHLWRRWATVERVVEDMAPTRSSLPIPKRTERRWRARYASAATVIFVLFATSNAASLEAIAMRLTRTSTRAALVAAYVAVVIVRPGRRLANIAERVDRLQRGIRLM
jgi:hypothetical protein